MEVQVRQKMCWWHGQPHEMCGARAKRNSAGGVRHVPVVLLGLKSTQGIAGCITEHFHSHGRFLKSLFPCDDWIMYNPNGSTELSLEVCMWLHVANNMDIFFLSLPFCSCLMCEINVLECLHCATSFWPDFLLTHGLLFSMHYAGTFINRHL